MHSYLDTGIFSRGQCQLQLANFMADLGLEQLLSPPWRRRKERPVIGEIPKSPIFVPIKSLVGGLEHFIFL
jgi:hypothetical protein